MDQKWKQVALEGVGSSVRGDVSRNQRTSSEIISNGDRIIHHSAILTDPECENRKEAVLSAIGIGFVLLDGLEEQLLAMLPDLEKEAEKAWDFIDQL